MADRIAGMTAEINNKLASNKEKVDRKVKKRQEMKPVSSLHLEWISSMKEDFGVIQVPEWVGVEYSLAKKLVSDVGFNKAVEIVRYFMRTWRKRRTSSQERRDELPNMKILWSLRSRLLAELEGAVNCPQSKREKLLKGEYDPILAEASPDRGWGD